MENNILDNKNLWQKKWAAIIDAFDKFEEALGKSGDSTQNGGETTTSPSDDDEHSLQNSVDSRRRGTLGHQRELIPRLRNFSTTIFNFLYDGFYPENDAIRGGVLESDQNLIDALKLNNLLKQQLTPSYPKDYVINKLLRQVSLDLVRLEQALHLRSNIAENTQKQQRIYALADFLAEEAVKPCSNYYLKFKGESENKKVVITHPANAVEVRLLPYCEAVLIGFPITAYFDGVTMSTDFLALSHEMGHMLYRSGRTEDKNTSLRDDLYKKLYIRLAQLRRNPQESRWLFRWLEEIFADTYGCLLDGPVCVVGFQELLATGRPTHLHEDDGKHPIPVLRPLIQTQILRSIAKKHPGWQEEEDEGEKATFNIQEIASLLDLVWQKWVENHWDGWVNRKWPYGYDKPILIGNNIFEAGTDILRGADYEIGGSVKNGQDILDDVQIIIDLILDAIMPEIVSRDQPWKHIPKTKQIMIDITRETVEDPRPQVQMVSPVKIEVIGQKEISAPIEPEELAAALFEKYCKRKIDGFKASSNVNNFESFELDTPTWLKDGFDKLHDDVTRIDQIIDLVLFSGWTNEGPEIDHGGG